MVTRIKPDLRIFFLETGYHFWETLIFCVRVATDWNLNVIDLHRHSRWDVFVRQNLRNLPLDDPNLCCYINKVQPMQKAVIGLKAWMTGIRRDQTAERSHAQFLELENDGLIKVNPLLNWTKADVTRYIEEHHLPGHPFIGKRLSFDRVRALYGGGQRLRPGSCGSLGWARQDRMRTAYRLVPAKGMGGQVAMSRREAWLAANTLTPERIALARRVVEEVRGGRDLGASLRAHSLPKGGVLGKSFLVAAYHEMVADGTLEADTALFDKLRMKPVRTLSA